MDFLEFINNGYSPYYIFGNGGLGYKPPIIGSGTLISEADEEGKFTANVPYQGKETDYTFSRKAPLDFLWSVYYNPNADEEDKELIKEILNERLEKNPNKFMETSNEYLNSLPKKEQKKQQVEILDFYSNKVNKEADQIMDAVQGMKKLGNKIIKQEEEEQEEQEDEEQEEADEEGSVITLEGSDIDEEEEELKEITLKDVRDNIKRLTELKDNKLKEAQKLANIGKKKDAVLIEEEQEKTQKELEDYEELYKRLTTQIDLLYKPVRKYDISHLSEEDQKEIRELELDANEFKNLGVKNVKTIEQINQYEEIATPDDLTHGVPAYSETFMKETIFNKHGEKLDAGAVLEKNISGVENQKLAEAITGEDGSIISWSNEELIKPVVINGKTYKISEGQASKFCYDNFDNENYNLIECKKYDGVENFEKLVKEYTETYNNFFVIYKKEIEDTKIDIEILNEIITETEKANKKGKQIKEDFFDEDTEKYKGMSLKELKKSRDDLVKGLDEEISLATTNGKFDEDKFKLLFYKRSRYPGITMKITKFPDSGVEYIDFNNENQVYKCPNSKSYYKKLADRGRRLFSIEASKDPNQIGRVSNISSGSKSTGQDINKVLDSKFKFKEKGKPKNNYDIIFSVATDDALLKFNYSDFVKKRIGSNQFVANFFRGTYSFYNKEPLLDSVLIPLDCFVPIKLSEVYNIQAKPKQVRKKKIVI